jgi:hypothetical protein
MVQDMVRLGGKGAAAVPRIMAKVPLLIMHLCHLTVQRPAVCEIPEGLVSMLVL